MKKWTQYQTAKKNRERAEAVYEESKTNAKPEGTRPLHEIHFLGLCGPKVDSINFYTEQVTSIFVKLAVFQYFGTFQNARSET